LFLSEKNLVASVGGIYGEIIDPYEGIVAADDAAVAAVKASLKKRPAPEARPVLVISALPREGAAPLAEAALANFLVVTSHQFSGHSPNTITHVRETISPAEFLVMIDGDAERRARAVQLTPDAATTFYDATWPKDDVAERVKELTKKLVEKVD
jgi:hypothetical protein